MLSRGQPLPVAQLSLPQGPQGPSPQATVPSGQGGLLGSTQRGPCQPFLSWSTKEPGTPHPRPTHHRTKCVLPGLLPLNQTLTSSPQFLGDDISQQNAASL